MKLVLSHSSTDIEKVKTFCRARRNLRLVKFRKSTNLSSDKPIVTKDRFWRALTCMRLTSRQKSGPNSAVVKLATSKPFPLRLDVLRKVKPLDRFIASELRAIPGMRHYDVAASQLATNFQILEGGRWVEFLDLANDLRVKATISDERVAANEIQSAFKGFGPKQSRNFLQALGLTRYEIPLDSRVMKWLRDELEFPLPISGSVLADSEYYELVLDKIQCLCADAHEYPCILNAAIFASADDDEWAPEMIEF